MRSRLGLLALAPIVLMLASCSPPPQTTLHILNESGQRIAFLSCKGERIVIDPDGTAELTDIWMAFNPQVHWSCYRKKDLTIEAGDVRWTYHGWERRVAGKPKDRRPNLWSGSYGARARHGRLSTLTVRIEAGGTIRAGLPGVRVDNGAERWVTDFAAEQPRGFPLVPQK